MLFSRAQKNQTFKPLLISKPEVM